MTAVLTQRAVRAARNADGGEVVKGRPVDGGKFRFNVASYLARGSVFPKFLRLGKEHIRSYAMRDPLEWAAHYRKRAAECIELADNSIDAGIEAHYRSLTGRYIKLAEAEEDFAATRPGHPRLSPGLDATG